MVLTFLIYITFAIIILFSIRQLFFVDLSTYSINKFIWFYVLLFWGFVPLVQYFFGFYPWDISVSDTFALKANLIILMWILVYNFFYKRKVVFNYPSFLINKPQQINLTLRGCIFLIFIQFAIFSFYCYKMGGVKLLRGEELDAFEASSQPIQLIFEQVSRALTTMITLVFLIVYKNNKLAKSFFFLLISLSFLLITNFPLSIPRYMAGAFYIAVIFVAKPFFKHASLPILGLLILFVLVYPAVSMVRNISSFSDFNFSNTSLFIFLSEDFDNYSTLNMALQYVHQNGITFGHQLLGVLLFFVPRSIWLNKPVGSGHFMALSQGWSFTNISCPFVAEGYINFGFLGVFFFAMILGLWTRRMDNFYYQSNRITASKLFYPISLGMSFFILRGDLLSSFAYTISFVIATYIALFLCKPFIRYA